MFKFFGDRPSFTAAASPVLWQPRSKDTMPPLPAVKPPSITEFLELVQGPRVEIYVGPERKLFTAPKALLCYYSKYFDCCFNGGFEEAQTQKLELPDDPCDYFEALLLFMVQGIVSSKTFSPRDEMKSMVALRCIEFLEYTDKYDLGSIGSLIVYEPLRKAWEFDFDALAPDESHYITGEDVEVIFRIAPIGHRLRRLALLATLWAATDVNGELGRVDVDFRKQQRDIPGFAAGLLDIIIENSQDPIELPGEVLKKLRD